MLHNTYAIACCVDDSMSHILQQRISKLEAAAAHGRGGGEVEAATQAFAPLMEER